MSQVISKLVGFNVYLTIIPSCGFHACAGVCTFQQHPPSGLFVRLILQTLVDGDPFVRYRIH